MAEHTFSRREFMRLAGATAAGAVLASCAPAAKQPEAPGEAGPVTLEYWFCWSGRYQEIQRTICDAFEKEFEGKIKISDVAVASNIRQKLLTAVAADQAPDVTACFGDLVSLAAQGAFLAIDDYIASSDVIDLDALYKPRVEACKWRNKMFGFPYNCSAEVPLMNVTLFEEAGLDPYKQIETWDEFTEISKQLVKFDSSGTLQVAAYVNWYPRHMLLWFWINGGDAYDPANDKITIDQPLNVEGLQTVIDYAWNVYGDIAKADDYLAGQGSESGSPFCINALAIDYAGDWMPSTYYAWCPEVKMWPQLFPKGPQGKELTAVGAGDFIGILRGAPHPDEAYKFAEWQVMKGNLLWTQAGVDTDCVKKNAGVVRAEWPAIFGDKAAEVAKNWALWGEKSRAVENFPAFGFMVSELYRVCDLAFHKQITAAEALAEAQKTVDEEMDKYRIPE